MEFWNINKWFCLFGELCYLNVTAVFPCLQKRRHLDALAIAKTQFSTTLKPNTLKLHQYAKLWVSPDNNVHGANMGHTWVLSAPDGPQFGPMSLAIGVLKEKMHVNLSISEIRRMNSMDKVLKRNTDFALWYILLWFGIYGFYLHATGSPHWHWAIR